MPTTLLDAMMARPPTAEHPLLGIVILIVEDSRYSSEAIRLMCQRSGARIRRAESLASATRHLRAYRPRVALVDLGLPDGSGLRLIEQLANAEPRIEALIAISGDPGLSQDAMRAGADLFLAKPIASVTAFQATILSLLPPENRPAHVLQPLEDIVAPDAIALRDDLSHLAELLAQEANTDLRSYIGTLLRSLERETGNAEIAALARKFNSSGSNPCALKELSDHLRHQIEILPTV